MLPRVSALLGISLLMMACSGAESSELFGEDGNGASGGATNASGSSASPTEPSGASSSSSSPAKTEEPGAPAAEDPGTSTPNDTGTTAPKCAVESLANDDFKNADVFESCIAGKLADRDVDFVTTTAPADAKQIFIAHTETGGPVSYRVFVNGFVTTFTGAAPESIPAIPNAKYTFKIEAAGTSTADRTWELDVSFQ